MREATCQGEVVVTRADAKLHCEELKVRFDDKGEVERLVCQGAARFLRGAEEASAQVAKYDRSQQTVQLTGQAKLRRGGTQLSGTRVVFLLDSNEVVVEGDAKGSWQKKP